LSALTPSAEKGSGGEKERSRRDPLVQEESIRIQERSKEAKRKGSQKQTGSGKKRSTKRRASSGLPCGSIESVTAKDFYRGT